MRLQPSATLASISSVGVDVGWALVVISWRHTRARNKSRMELSVEDVAEMLLGLSRPLWEAEGARARSVL